MILVFIDILGYGCGVIALLIALTVYANGVRAVPVVPSLPLSQVAQDRAEYLCTHPFSHQGFQIFFVNRHYYPSHWQGELLARGYTDATSLQRAWVNSPQHLKVMQDTRATELGVGQACGITVELLD